MYMYMTSAGTCNTVYVCMLLQHTSHALSLQQTLTIISGWSVCMYIVYAYSLIRSGWLVWLDP